MSLHSYLCFAICFFASLTILQAQSKSKEFHYRYNNQGDSVLILQKERHLNADSALIFKKHYHYEGGFQQNSLWREESALFSDNILTQLNTYYRKNAEPVTEKLETKYLSYTAYDSLDKIIWMRKYDSNNDLTREDTFTYNKKGLATEKWSYIYSGSTSVLQETYHYNCKNNLKKTKYYIVWNTVNIRGNATAKKTHRGTYKYKYKKGKLVAGKGKIRNVKYQEKVTYDEQGLVKSDIITFKGEEKYTQKDQKPTTIMVVDSTIRFFEKGLLLEEFIQSRNVFKEHTKYSYQDGLVASIEHLNKEGKPTKTIHYTIANGKYTKGIQQNYDNKGMPNFTTHFQYNEKGLLVEEKLSKEAQTIQIKQYSYDIQNRMTEQLTINTAGKKTERIVFEYF